MSGMNVKELFVSGLYEYILGKPSQEKLVEEHTEELKHWLVVKS